jgi:serine/threonine protein kinase
VGVSFTAPPQLKNWQRLGLLGNGAFGDAWIYENSKSRGEYAVVKFLLRPGPSLEVTRTRFEREREILSKLRNPKVSRLLDDDLNSNPPWIATEFFSGRSLESLIHKDSQLVGKEWVRLASDVLEGLTYVHAKGVVHRDLNPGNIVDTALGYKIIDFGIASSENTLVKYSGNHSIRHWHYASPEQLNGEGTDAKTDVFTLATLLVYAATNKSPWTQDPRVFTDERTQKIVDEVHVNAINTAFKPLYYDMSSNQKLLLRSMHERNPANRPTAQEALKELKKLADKEFVSYLANDRPKQTTKVEPVKVSTQQVKPSTARTSPKITITPRQNLSRDQEKALKKEASHRQQMMIKIVHSEFGPNSLASDFPQRPGVKKMLTILELMTTEEMEEVSRQVNAKLGWEFIKNLAEPSGAPDKPKISKTKLAVSENRIQVVEGSAHIDPAKLTIKDNSVQVETDGPLEKILRNRKEQAQIERLEKQQTRNQSSKFVDFISKYWKDLLIGWLTTPFGWLIYRAYRKRHLSREVDAKELTTSHKKWIIGFLLTHGLSFGFLGPAAGIPLAYRVKTRAVSVFMAINSIAVMVFFGEIISTPEGSEAATYATVIWGLNLIYGFFLPVAMRMNTSDDEVETRPVFSKIETAKPTESEKIDPFDDEEYFANAQAKLQQEPKKSWNDLRDAVTEILNHSGIERFNIEFAQPDISGIYFQGFRDKSGSITIEAAANLSVRPEITNEQNRSIIGIGWEPPAGDNPNYIQFLDLTQSNLKFIAELILTTLRDGYGAGIEGLQPVFSVSMGGEIIYVDFAEFKRLTSQ